MIASSWIDQVPTWALFSLAMLAAWRVSRGGGGSAVSELAKANEILTKRKDELGGEVRDLTAELAASQARTDITKALEPAVEKITGALSAHEERAIERHQQQLDQGAKQIIILGMMAEKMGADPNGH